ncbi:MAG: GNAT family N-acetyltransferase [Solirubrobacteraceae bacterium]
MTDAGDTSTLSYPDPALSDGVVVLRPWADADLGFIVAACQDPEISRYSPVIPSPYTEADALQWLELMDSIRLADDGFDLAITRVADGGPLGAIGIGRLDRMLATATTGYWLAREARGQGYVSRALRLLARWMFEELGLARIELTTDPENLGSQRVAERCGFTREGRLRSHMLIRHSGQRRDSLIYGLLPGELTD